MTKAILMYHRICDRSEETECYFERGTAVTPEAFRAQLKWLASRFAFTTVRDLVFGSNDAPTVALSFDDGYRDVIDHALPVCRELGAVGTVYVCASTLAPTSTPLWFDRYYALIPRLMRAPSRQDVQNIVRIECGEQPPESDLRWWVRGPLKARLATMDRAAREAVLERLTGVADLSSPPAFKYLDHGDLKSLMSFGWEVGGHGAHHDRLTDISAEALESEFAASVRMLLELNAPKPWTMAYPDGAVNESVSTEAARSFGAAVAVTPRLLDSSLSSLHLPRLLCRGNAEIPHKALAPRAQA